MVEKIGLPLVAELDLTPTHGLVVKDWDETDKDKSLYNLTHGKVKLVLYYIIEGGDDLPEPMRGKRLVVSPAGLQKQGYI